MAEDTTQMQAWSGSFGKDYTDRNPHTTEELNSLYKKNFGISRSDLNSEFIGGMDRSIRILEVGANVGSQLSCLQDMGFERLYGIELQSYAVEEAKKNTRIINLIQGSVFDIPYKDDFFDLVFTSGVLIHIHPDDLLKALNEIHRCSRQYIWGFEYFSETCEMIRYRGNENMMWKNNFAKKYLDIFPDLSVVMEKRVSYLEGNNVDCMFLLKKK